MKKEKNWVNRKKKCVLVQEIFTLRAPAQKSLLRPSVVQCLYLSPADTAQHCVGGCLSQDALQ